jgi:hypothetical protein
VPTAVTAITGSLTTIAADGPCPGLAQQTTRASNASHRLRRPAVVTVAVTSRTSPASTGARNWTSESQANGPSSASSPLMRQVAEQLAPA